MATRPDTNIMTVGELIDTAFGQPEVNIVHHKLVQTVLFLLARQLRLLERRVEIGLGSLEIQQSSSSLSVTEVKVHAKKQKKGHGAADGIKQGKGSDKISLKLGGKIDQSDKTIDKITIKSTSDKTTSQATSDKTASQSTSDKTTSKSTSDKTASQSTSDKITSKSTSDKTTGQSTSDKTTSKSTSDKTTSQSTSDKTSTEPTLLSKVKSTDKSILSSARKAVLDKTSTSSDSSKSAQDYLKILNAIEEQRERELRVIHQRADSRDGQEKSPTPIKSLDSVEATTYEKLLVVERVPAEEAKARAARELSGAKRRDKTPQLSVVTQEQFEELATIVRHIQRKLGIAETSGFPENAQLMEELRKGASLTDAMAALQLSARLEATEKMLQRMLSLITDLASQTPGIDMGNIGDDMEVLFGGPGATGHMRSISQKSTAASQKKQRNQVNKPSAGSVTEIPVTMSLPQSIAQLGSTSGPIEAGVMAEEDELMKKNRVTYEELDEALNELFDKIMKMVDEATTRSTVNANNALKIANKLEGRLEASLNLGNRMNDLEVLVTNYAEQINALDTGLSSQMTNYQEELTQMQHDLESGLETMAEVLANTGGDATAVAELNVHFNELQADIDLAMMRQKELSEIQCALSLDFDALRKQIEVLRETKSDREEVTDALRDKAGLGALNGLVSRQQFDAVRGDFEKQIGVAYDKFNNQEITWQKAIDDLLRELNEKADIVQVTSLRDEIVHHLELMRKKLKFMMDIVGEPKAAALSKKLHRDAACLSCAAPAQMTLEAPTTVPALPAMRPPAIGAETSQPTADGDHGPCYPGHLIPHPIDPRSKVCHRWCGGSHTVLSHTVSRVPPSMTLKSLIRKSTQEQGTDGRMYLVDEPKLPCAACNIPVTASPKLMEQLQAKSSEPPVASMALADYDLSDINSPPYYPALPVEGDSMSLMATPPIERPLYEL